MSAVAKLSYFFRTTFQGMRQGAFVHVVAVVTIAMALFVAGLVRGGALYLHALVETVGSDVQLQAYLREGTPLSRAQALADRLAAQTGGTAIVVSAEEGLQRLAAELGELGAGLSELPENPLTPTVELTLPPAQRDPGRLRALAATTRAAAEVENVEYGEAAVERLSAIARALGAGAVAALFIVALATVVIVSATLQLAIYARHEEIEIQKLVGATDRFVKAPFLLEGLLQGVAASLAAMAGLWLFSAVAGDQLSTTFAFLSGGALDLRLLWRTLALELFAAGAALGLIGSMVAVGRFLRA